MKFVSFAVGTVMVSRRVPLIQNQWNLSRMTRRSRILSSKKRKNDQNWRMILGPGCWRRRK
ncbi:hypothetical protein LINPERHAP2_LOCUS28773 [Linum perenne]